MRDGKSINIYDILCNFSIFKNVCEGKVGIWCWSGEGVGWLGVVGGGGWSLVSCCLVVGGRVAEKSEKNRNSHQTVGWVFRFIFPASLPVYNRVSDFQYFQFFFYLHNNFFSWHRDHAGWKERKILDGYMSSRKNLPLDFLKIGNSSFVHDLLSICEGAGPSPRWLVTGLRAAP